MKDKLKFYSLSGATFYDCINTIYQFIKSFLDNKMSIFEEYGAFKFLLCLFFWKFCQSVHPSACLLSVHMFAS